MVRGTEGIAVQMATCCHPIPDDAIVGTFVKDKGLRCTRPNVCTHNAPDALIPTVGSAAVGQGSR